MAFSAGNQSSEIMTDPLTTALWYACAGPLVTLPEKEERVYYFPEGHLEQLQASLGQIPELEIPTYNLPSKLLCKVTDLLRNAELGSDDVYAKIVLVPQEDQVEPIIPDVPVPKPEKYVYQSLSKTLTAWDTNTRRGGLSLHRKHAEKCLPVMDMSQEPQSQELIATDLHNKEWHFKHVLRGQLKRHSLSTGWNSFLNSKRMVVGDALVLISGDDKKDLRIGVKRAMRTRFDKLSSLMSPENMHLGVLVNVVNAIKTRSEFSVRFHPRIMKRSEFVISINKYLEAKNRNWSVGMRFMMRFEAEDVYETWFIGRIVGLHANESWPNSEWKTLKVQWDEPSSFSRPERVSAWDIEPLVTDSNTPFPQSQPPQRNKRARDPVLPSPPTGLEISHGNGFRLFGVEIVKKNNVDECVPGAAAVEDQCEPMMPLGIGDLEYSSPRFHHDSQT